MRNLLYLSVLAVMVAGTTGCFHNNNCWRPSMFGSRQPTQAQLPCCPPPPCCPQTCCDPCAGAATTTVGSPVISAPVPCCQ